MTRLEHTEQNSLRRGWQIAELADEKRAIRDLLKNSRGDTRGVMASEQRFFGIEIAQTARYHDDEWGTRA